MECGSLGTGNVHHAACFFSKMKDEWRYGTGDGAFASAEFVGLSSELSPMSICNTAVGSYSHK